ncbi:glutamate formimidoyltransferase [Geothrix sp. PMB-07]|uniref:glutamate formimidoyltransferase n=1 Tax=Geothrix sp. PMB-07 TaxID=3068640 RepID=UPI002741D06C|nr:glutamate formimidoyltransferase [Geothrix sp. PMB-07]WLT33195.1 glutamate formimidoyltransferase [Geothrix sp. PMB-07]
MSRKLVECVPNISEGRDAAKIKQVTDAVAAVAGVELLDVDPGADTNRTVITFVGEPEAVLEGAFRCIAEAAKVIDMTQHHGAHPRMGATDVTPFVPVEGVTMEECAELARRLGERVARELAIPVYLYEAAAAKPERRNLAEVRRGEYEGLAKKLQDPQWQPDFPAAYNPAAGACIIGAREFLVAYNVTLNSGSKDHATDIAFELREKGRVARRGRVKPYYQAGELIFYAEGSFPCGNCDFTGATFQETIDHCAKAHGYDLPGLMRLNDVDPANPVGQKVRRRGIFDHCKAIGWYVDTYRRAQISINLTDYKQTAPHTVLEEARSLAHERGLVVTGSEIVGLVPFQCLLASGKHYLKAMGKSTGVPVSDILQTAVFSMGLEDVSPFEVEKKVLGLPTYDPKALVSMQVHAFTDEVSRDTPAPGGGSIAALAGSLGAALASMVANLAQGGADLEKDAKLIAVAEQAQVLKDRLMVAVDADTNAFNAFMDARRLPDATPEQKAARQAAMQAGLKVAIDVPLDTAKASYAALELAGEASRLGKVASITDAAVGAQMAFAGVRGGIWNVVINLKDITDAAYVADMQAQCADLLAKATGKLAEVTAYIDQKLVDRLNKVKK